MRFEMIFVTKDGTIIAKKSPESGLLLPVVNDYLCFDGKWFSVRNSIHAYIEDLVRAIIFVEPATGHYFDDAVQRLATHK